MMPHRHRPYKRSVHIAIHKNVERWLDSGTVADTRRVFELFHVFHAQFGSLLDTTLYSIQLTHDSDWMVVVSWDDDTERRILLSSLLQGEVGASDVPLAVHGLLECCTEPEAAQILEIFNAPAMALIENQAQQLKGWQAKSDRAQRATADFYLDCARLLAIDLADGVNLESATIEKLRHLPATGIRQDESQSRWEEIVGCSIHVSSSIWSEGFNDDIKKAAYEVFSALPRAKQLALWMCHRKTEDGIKDIAMESPELGADGFKLSDKEYLFDDVANAVWGSAINAANEKL